MHAIIRKTTTLEAAFSEGIAAEEIKPGNKIVPIAECTDIRIPK
jgi:hypothetical protein